MNKKKILISTITEEESALFRSAVKGIKALIHSKITPTPIPASQQKPRFLKNEAIKAKSELIEFSDYDKYCPVTSETLLSYTKNGIPNKILRKLQLGQYNVEAILDLHGKTVEEARQTVGYFLLSCQQKGLRHVLLIHGKGNPNKYPILKNRLNNWLRQTEHVLAFCSATTQNGHSGALYVLLRR